MNHIVIIGAGKEGKAYLGEVYDAAGWNVTFLDKDSRVVEATEGDRAVPRYGASEGQDRAEDYNRV